MVALKRQGKLWIMISMTGSFFLVELVVGYITGSIALVADSFHMLSDLMALFIAVYAIRLAKKTGATKFNSFGWQRAEILGALINAVFLLALCFTLFIESIQRFVTIEEVNDPKLILIVGGVGLGINLVGMTLFADVGHGHSHSHGGSHGHGHGHGKKQEKHGHAHDAREGEEHQDHEGHDHGHSHGAEEGELEGHGRPQGDLFSDGENDKSYIQLEIGQSFTVKRDFRSEKANYLNLEKGDEVEVMGHVKRNIYIGRSNGVEGKFSAKNLVIPSRSADFLVSPGLQNEIAIEIDEPEIKVQQHAQGSNMRAVFLHVLGDALGSIGVMISALVIWLVDGSWKYYLDPTISLLITFLIVASAVPLVRETASVLLQGVPNFDFEGLKRTLLNIPGVQGIHELHVWRLADNKLIGSAHLRVDKKNASTASSKAKTIFHLYDVHSCTLQVEVLKKPKYSSRSELTSADETTDQTCLLACEEECQPKACCPDDLQGKAAPSPIQVREEPSPSQTPPPALKKSRATRYLNSSSTGFST